MSVYVAVIERQRGGCSRNQNLTYVDVVKGFDILPGADLAAWITAHPTHPWNDTQFEDYVVELDNEAEYDTLTALGVDHAGLDNLPRWQQQAGNTGSTKALGSYADPTDDQTTFTEGNNIPDDRFILRMYDDDPVAEPSAVHIGTEEFDETADTVVTRYIQLFDQDDDAITTNAGNQRTEISGNLMDFDFGSSHAPSLSAGVTSFGVDISAGGNLWFRDDRRWRVFVPDDGSPSGAYHAQIFTKVLRVTPGE